MDFKLLIIIEKKQSFEIVFYLLLKYLENP